MLIPCSACGGEVDFKSRSSVFAVCPYCSSMLVRTDLKVEDIGKMAALPPDMSPLQIGTIGKFERVGFEIIGKQKKVWEHGAWTEWYVMLEDGRDGWLAEAQGFFMMSFPVTSSRVPALSTLGPGQSIVFDGVTFEVEDIKEAKSMGAQGELPGATFKGKTSTCVDLVGPEERFLSIEYGEKGSSVFLGSFGDFEDFSFANLREVEGW